MGRRNEEAVRLGTAKAAPGEKAWGQLRVRDGARSVRLPVVVIHGAAPGEHVVLLANQHGGELNGIEVLRRFAEETDPRRVRGTIFAIPSANPQAAMLVNECWPEGEDVALVDRVRGCPYLRAGEDRYTCRFNMNRKWPGRRGGLLVERITLEIWRQAILAPHRKASLALDLHCHEASSAVYARSPADVDMGVVAGVNVVHTRSSLAVPYCVTACARAGIRAMTLELGGQNNFRLVSIADGQRMVRNVLSFWGVLRCNPQYPESLMIMDPWRDQVVKERKWARPSYVEYRARHAGLIVYPKVPYVPVRKGEVVCVILDPFTGRVVEECRAPMSGALLQINWQKPIARRDQGVFKVSQARRVRPAKYVRRLRVEDYRNPAPPTSGT